MQKIKDVITVNNRNYIIMTIAVPNGLRDSVLDLFHTVILEADKNGNAISFYYLYKQEYGTEKAAIAGHAIVVNKVRSGDLP